MKALNLILSIVILLVTVSCGTKLSSQAQSEYLDGYNMAREFGKKDAMEADCYDYPLIIGRFHWFPTRVDVSWKVQTHIGFLREQGRSKTFINGFYFGYNESYNEFFEFYCGR